MAAQAMQRVEIWSGRLRLAHWLMAVAVLVLLATGWLLPRVPTMTESVRDLHYVAGYVLLAALALRFYLLLFGKAAEQWTDLLPRGPQWRAAWHTLRFYLSLGRAPLPAWYAHNPLWGPVYLAWWALLVAQVLTGLLPGWWSTLGVQPWWWHSLAADAVAMLVAAHVVAVFLHDLKGGGADVSAMINGFRWFRTGKEPGPLLHEHSVSLDALLRSKSNLDR